MLRTETIKDHVSNESILSFEGFVSAHESNLRNALVAAYGPDNGRDAAAAALAWAWEHWGRVQDMSNPAGYLYRVGQSKIRPWLRRPSALPAHDPGRMPDVEPALPDALASLSRKQRQVVVLMHAYDVPRQEVADLLRISPTTVDTHLSRGLHKLRTALGVDL